MKQGKPMVDDDNPEWTKEDFARARPATEVLSPKVVAAFGKGGSPADRSVRSRKASRSASPRT